MSTPIYVQEISKKPISLLLFAESYGKLKAVLPTKVSGKALWIATGGGFFAPCKYRKGACTMITYSDLIDLGMLVVDIIALILQFKQVSKKK